MFVRNKTASYQGFSIGKQPFKVAPGEVTILPDDAEKDPTYKILLSRGIVEKVSEKDALGELGGEKKKKKDEIPVKDAKDDVKNQTRLVPCVAKKHDGTACGVNVSVPMNEYDENTPYFCGHHKDENPEDYEKVDGKWVKHDPQPTEDEVAKAAEEQAKAEEEAAKAKAEEEKKAAEEAAKAEAEAKAKEEAEAKAKAEKEAAEAKAKEQSEEKPATKKTSTRKASTKKNTAKSVAENLR